MSKVIHRSIFIIAIIVLITSVNAFAIDTDDWERQPVFITAEPTSNWLVKVAQLIMGPAFKDYKPGTKGGEKYFNKFINTSDNSIKIKPKSPWHDISELSATYQVKDNELFSIVTYTIKKGSMTLLDVIERYGVERASIVVHKDLSKEIAYMLTYSEYSDLNRVKTKADKLYYLYSKGTVVTFLSLDKVFVDSITVMVVKDIKPK